jgi:CIC family chloride channel protein
MIQFAAAVSGWVGRHTPVRWMRLSRQVACGAAAGVAAAYHAPLAGVLFAREIVIGDWAWAEVPQLAIASLAGWLISRTMLGAGPLFAVREAIPWSWQMLWVLPLAVLAGVVGPKYQALLRSLSFAGRWPVALIWAGAVVGVLGLLNAEVWGNGDVALSHMLTGSPALLNIAAILALRLVATTFCVGTGTVGGVFTPTLFAGAAMGLAAGELLHLPTPLLLGIAGLSALLAAVTHAPMMAKLMAVELTGQWHLLPLLLILNLMAYRVARWISPHSLYAIATPNPGESDSLF